ncbi:MAG: hypothetical protein P1P88_00375 [Bacteroidales bacterium]|nr:hypothetical protein [Bacteroidales bacterium]
MMVSQEKIDFPTVNTNTYTHFINSEWKEVIKTGKKSLDAGIDFYYLQVRMGIAYYNQHKYRQAIPYLERSLAESIDNEYVTEYLYFAYLFSGRYNDAQKLSKKFSGEFLQKAGIKGKNGIRGINIETKFENRNDYKINVSLSDTLIQYVQNDFSYFSVGLESVFKNKSRLFLNYSRVAITGTFEDLNTAGSPISGTQDIYQNQLYLGYVVNLTKGLNLLLSGNVLNIAVDKITDEQTSGFGGGYSSRIGSRTISNEFVAYAAIYQDISLFKIGAFASYSNLYKNLQIQPGLSLTFYPLGNANLYTCSSLHYQVEKIDVNRYHTTIFKQALGLGLWGLYIEPSITFGELSNFIEGDGFIVNNGNYLISDRKEIFAYTWLFKGKLNIYAKYQNYTSINYYSINSIINSNNVNHQTITGGIKWNF